MTTRQSGASAMTIPMGAAFEYGLKARLALAEGFLGFFVVFYVLEGAVPADDLAFLVSPRRGAGSHPSPDTVDATYTILRVEGIPGSKRLLPCFESWRNVVGMKDAQPAIAERLLLGKAR